ncbi:MAG: hypothetical protein N3A55_10770 [Methylohalobius sp.]|nr:hypothetical protein [Methylohalobius sp.]
MRPPIKQVLLWTGIAVLTGCASVRAVKLEDGKIGYHIDCSGYGPTWGRCHQAAWRLCTQGYEILDADIDLHDMIVGGQAVWGGRFMNRALTIRCRTPPPPQTVAGFPRLDEYADFLNEMQLPEASQGQQCPVQLGGPEF